MLAWLTENIATMIICAVLIGVVAAIIVSMIRNKKKGKSSCGCGCADCPMSGSCSLQRTHRNT
ncbi:FeoB-associated Cys-rich membrane protein [Ruminococcus sp.]|uniref:FeoB-associated Cys-rich membrane protein n=1 Tax=Ruminococcus sp. TaxID=41978 RepID=UPI003457AD4B